MKILITGAEDFIGTHARVVFFKAGLDVRAFVIFLAQIMKVFCSGNPLSQ